MAGTFTNQTGVTGVLDEAELRRRYLDLVDFVENATVPLHWVGPDGIILWANQAELDLLGYARDEYVGRPISDFHADQNTIQDMLMRLSAGETLHDFESRLRRKDGSFRNVLISSSVYRRNGQFIHTRCFTRDVTQQRIAEQTLQDNRRLLSRSTREERAAKEAVAQSRAQLESVIDAAPLGIVMVDEELRVLHVNAAARLLNGVKANSEVGDLADLMRGTWSAQTMAAVRGHFRTVLETGEPSLAREFASDRADLKTREYHDWQIHRIILPDGRYGAACYFSNVSERVRSRQTALARESAANLAAAIVTSSADAIITKDLHGVITSWNASAERIFGYTEREAVGKPVTMLFPRDHINEETDIIRRIKAGERVDHYETLRQRKDGSLVPISLTVSPVRNDLGEIVGASKIARDITSQKEYERQLINQANELEQFAYVASHDLREPLRKVALYSELLTARYGDQVGKDAKKYSQFISEAVNRMQGLIVDLLDFSRANRTELNPEPVDLSATLDGVLDDLEIPIKESGTKIIAGRLPILKANAFQMHQLLQNLISNAIKFRSKSSPTVEIRAEEKPGEVVISVRDNGIGIEAAYHEKIFRVFQRLHRGGEYPGTGIGLAICKKIVEHHGGKIWFKSDPGKETVFFVSLPNRPEPEERTN